MVVMGSKGKSDFEDFLVGSFTTKMYRKCAVPLVIIRNKFQTNWAVERPFAVFIACT